MRIVAEHPDLRRQYEQIVASQKRFGFFSQLWVQDALHPQWAYVLTGQNEILLRIPVAKKWGLKAYLQPLFIRDLELLADMDPRQYAELVVFLQRRSLVHLNIALLSQADLQGNTGRYQVLKWDQNKDFQDAFSQNIKRSLKKAKDLKLLGLPYAAFQTFFISQKGQNLGNLNAAAWGRLEKLVSVAQNKGTVFCYGAYKQEQLLAVGLFFEWKTQFYFMKGTLNEEGKKCGALVFLLAAVLEKHALTCQTLDFIGSNQDSIASFYKKFGAEDQSYQIVKGRIPLV